MVQWRVQWRVQWGGRTQSVQLDESQLAAVITAPGPPSKVTGHQKEISQSLCKKRRRRRGDCQDGRARHGTRTVWTCVFLVPIGPGWLETHDEDEDDDKSDCHRRCKIELLRVAMESSSSFSRLSSARIATDRRRLLREKEESNKEKGKKKDAPCAYCCITSTSSIKEEKE